MTTRRVLGRARTHADRSGDPLDGLVNLFDLAIVLAVAFLLAALSYLRLTGLFANQSVTVLENQGNGRQTLIVKNGAHFEVLHLTNTRVSGSGTRVGTVYRLSDGRLVYVPGG